MHQRRAQIAPQNRRLRRRRRYQKRQDTSSAQQGSSTVTQQGHAKNMAASAPLDKGQMDFSPRRLGSGKPLARGAIANLLETV